IYLGDAAFVTEMQKRVGREKEDLNIPQQQKRPIAKPLSEIAAQHKDRKTAIIEACKTGAYSQREIGEYYQLHPTTVGVILRKNKNSLFWI
ncbi:MAG: addiction module toxin RelE, partial [Nitrosomonas sp.]|nr:addiction module toxin RelE [Nitrosomonas sp.]